MIGSGMVRVVTRVVVAAWLAALASGPWRLAAEPLAAQGRVTKYVRFQHGQMVAYGIVEGDRVRPIQGDLFGSWKPGETTLALSEVKLLPPTQPSKILAAAGNYASHLTDRPVPKNPEFFFKPPSCLIGCGEAIVIPPGTTDVHYEGELVVVIGRRAKNVPKEEALRYVLGVTCGIDVSARDWQKNDVQWWRAKGCDTFGPCGPWIVTGLDYDHLGLQLRLNGQVKQQANTRELIFGVAEMVSFISRHMTLEPGDLIFTGTPGTTSAIQPGDRLELEIEGIGVLANPVTAAGRSSP